MLMSARLGIQITVVVLVRKLEVVFLTLFVYCTNAVSSDVSMILLVDSRQWVRCLEALSANCSSPMAVMKRVYVFFVCSCANSTAAEDRGTRSFFYGLRVSRKRMRSILLYGKHKIKRDTQTPKHFIQNLPGMRHCSILCNKKAR